MRSSLPLRAALLSSWILIAGLLVQAYGRSIEIAGLRDQLTRIDRHDRSVQVAAAAERISQQQGQRPIGK